MNHHDPISAPIIVQARTDAAAEGPAYSLRLAIADQPVKPSRRSLRRVCVSLMCEGHPVADADVAVGFHPLHAVAHGHLAEPGELLLARSHQAEHCGDFDGAMALEGGDYRVDVTINQRAHAGFVIHM